MSHLFSPLSIGPLTLANRIAIAPMCQYSAIDGQATPWHWQHFCQYAYSGAGLFMIEATAVEARGRITPACLGLYHDEQQKALAYALSLARQYQGPIRFGIQLAHAGRKGSSRLPWQGEGALEGAEAWACVAPSAIPFHEGGREPHALDESELEKIVEAFVAAAKRAVAAGVDLIEIHAAHGYLLHQFLSPLSNQRQDAFGGSLENRCRFPIAVVKAVKANLPNHIALGMRLTGTDWLDGGITPEETSFLAAQLPLDYVCITTGGLLPKVSIPVAPGYQVPFAARIKKATGLITRTAGMITDPKQADAIIHQGQADQVALARAFLDDPRWAWHAADALQSDAFCPPQYARGRRKSIR